MKILILTGLLIFPATAFSADCFDLAGRDYKIEPDLLRAVAFRESSWSGSAMNVVSEESYAVGMMQIHSQNFSHLSAFGITPRHLYHDKCLNIYTGAYYLALAFDRWGYNWRAVGAYNAGFRDNPVQESRRKKYATEVYNIYQNIKSGSLRTQP